MIRHGDYSSVFSITTNLDYIKTPQNTLKLKQNEKVYQLSKNISNILFPTEHIKIKKALTNLIAIELNCYNDSREQQKVYEKLKNYSSTLIAFSTKKRMDKFLTTFVKASKALQNVVLTNKNLFLLKTLKILILEVKKNADSA